MSDTEPTLPIEMSAEPPPSRGRPIMAVVCVVLAALLMTPAVVAFWGQRTLNDTERYTDTVGPLVDSAEVQNAIATTVTDAIEQQVDIEAILNDVFEGVIVDRPRLELLVGPLASAINGLIDREVREFIASDAFEDIWIAVNTRAQQTLVKLLEGEPTGAVTIEGDQVVLDVSDVIDQVKERLVARGLTIVENIPIPEVDRQIVLLDSPQLNEVRSIYAFTNPVARWLLWVVIGLFAIALVLARRRARMAVAIGAAVVVNALILAFALSVGQQVFINELSGTVLGPASSVFYSTLLSFLDRAQMVLLRLGFVIIVAGWFASSTRSGTAVRSAVANGLEGIGGAMAGGPLDGVGDWMVVNARWLRPVIGVLGFVVLVWGNETSPSRLTWAVALIVVLLAVVQVLVGVGRKEEAQGEVAAAEA